jgi:acyl-CoA reductase-like NAD-dependent aldehyde dehydrogenase
MYETKLLIGGKDVPATGGATFDRKDPVTGEVATRAAAASLEDVNKAVEAAAKAFPEWSQMGPNARRMILLKAADIMQSKAAKVGEVVTAETGATLGWGGFNVMLATSMLREAASMTTQITGEVVPSDQGQRLADHSRHPRGRHAARLRQHPCPQGVRAVPADP